MEKRVLEAIRLLGAQGGKAAAKNMTKAERIARAKKAIAARWAKAKKTKKGK